MQIRNSPYGCIMCVTVVKEGETLRVLDASEPIAEGTKLVLYTDQELRALEAERKGWLDLQMPSFIRGDEDESAEDLF